MQIFIPIILVALFILSFTLTYVFRKVAIKKSIMDIPNERSSHTIPTPRGGGLAIVVSWFIGLIILYISGEIETKLFYALFSVIPLVIIGLMDDIFSLSPIIRFSIQMFTAALALYFLGGVDELDFGFYIFKNKYILTLLFFIGAVWFINLYNFLDGIDAYASLQAIFMGLALFIFTGDSVLLILVASVLGFLFWNWPKAKIFMGDVGSTMLGFTLFVLGVYFNNNESFNFVNWLIISSIFWFDATITLIIRFKNKEKLSLPHKKHAYQRIVIYGYSHKKTVLIASVINLLILGIVILFEKVDTYGLLISFVLVILICSIIYWRIAHIHNNKLFKK